MAYLAEHAHHVSAARRHASPIACVATDISFHMARLAMLWMRRRDAMFRRKKHQPTLTWSRSRRRAPDLEDDPVSRETPKEPKSYGKSKVTRLSDDVEDDEVDPQDNLSRGNTLVSVVWSQRVRNSSAEMSTGLQSSSVGSPLGTGAVKGNLCPLFTFSFLSSTSALVSCNRPSPHNLSQTS